MALHKIGFVLLATLLAAGCSSIVTYRTFEQPPSPDQVAALWIPINLEPLEVDGQKAGPHFIPVSDRYKIELLPGAHMLLVRYSGLAGGPSCEQEGMLNSPPIPVTLKAAPGRTYRLTYARSDIELLFTRQLTNITVRVEDITADPALIKHLNRGWLTRSVSIHDPYQKTALSTLRTPGASVAAPLPAQTATQTAVHDLTALGQLKQWWHQADETERGEFLKWIVQQK